MVKDETRKASFKVVRDAHGRILPGQQSINPAGRPKGKTIKELVREWLENHPDDMRAFVQHFAKKNRELAWQMLEGSPRSQTDLTSGGEKIIPILGGSTVPSNDGRSENPPAN